MASELWKRMQVLNCRISNTCNTLANLSERDADCQNGLIVQSASAPILVSGIFLQDNLTITNANWGFSPGYNGEIYRTTNQPVGENLVIVPFQLTALANAPGAAMGTTPAGFTPVGVGPCVCELISGGAVVSSFLMLFSAGSFAIFGVIPAITAGDTITATITYQV